MNPSQKTDECSPKHLSRSNKKLFSTESSADKFLKKTRCNSKNKNHAGEKGGYERTRSSTILNKRNSIQSAGS